MENLSPESKVLYELLMTESTEEYERRFLEYKKARLDAVKQDLAAATSALRSEISALAPDPAGLLNPKSGLESSSSASPTTCSTASLHAPSSAVPTTTLAAVAPKPSTTAGDDDAVEFARCTTEEQIDSLQESLTEHLAAALRTSWQELGCAIDGGDVDLRSSGHTGVAAPMVTGISLPLVPPTTSLTTALVCNTCELKSTASPNAAYQLFDKIPQRHEWPTDRSLSFIVRHGSGPMTATAAPRVLREGVLRVKVPTDAFLLAAHGITVSSTGQATISNTDCVDLASLTRSQALEAMPWHPYLFLEDDSATMGNQFDSVPWVIQPLTFLIVKDMVALHIDCLLNTGLISQVNFKVCGSVLPEHLSCLLKFITWYAQYRWLPMTLSGHYFVSSSGCCFIQSGTAFVCMSLLHCAESNLWPPAHPFSGTELHKYFISLVELKPWPSWELALHLTNQLTNLVRDASGTCHFMLIHVRTMSQLLSLQPVEFSWLRRHYPNCKRLLLKSATHYDSACFAWDYCTDNNQFAQSVSAITMKAFLLVDCFQFCPAGEAFLYGYGATQFQWEIAWPTTTLSYSIHSCLHLYIALECSSVICYLEIRIKCSVMHLLGLCSFRPYMQNVGANGRLSSGKNSLLPSCCFYQGTQLNCNVGHYLQVHMDSYLDQEENPLYDSWLKLLLLGPDCSRDALFAWLTTETFRKHIWPTPRAQNQELITTGSLLRKMQLMRIRVLWQVETKHKFKEKIEVLKVKLLRPLPVRICMTLPMVCGQANFEGDRSIMTRAVFIDQVHISRDYYLDYACYFENVRADGDYCYDAVHNPVGCYLDLCNLIQVHVDNGYHRDSNSNQERQVQWDPGGSTWSRLGGKPKIKERGLSATCSTCCWAGWLGCHLGPWLVLEPDEEGAGKPIYRGRTATRNSAGNGRKASAW